MSCCNSNCNHDPCGSSFNQKLTLAAQYAQYAQTQANKAENLWEEFNALYLGAFALAPTQDNQGNPLQTGALYWNTATNQLFAWTGLAWEETTGFNEFTPFLATGTTTARNLATRFADVVNVMDFGAVGDGVTDDTLAFQNAAAVGKILIVPKPTVKYKFTNNFTISAVLFSDPKTTWANLTDSGKLTYGSPFYPDTNGANIARIKDRLFVGDGADFTGNISGIQGGFIPNAAAGANWGPRDSVIFGATDKGLIAVTGFSSNENRIRDAYLPTIGVAGFAKSTQAGPGAGSFAVWGLYSDVQLDSGVLAGAMAHGLEIAAKNNGSDRSSHPYLKDGGVCGVWLAGGGDPSYGGTGNACNTGIDFIKNGNTWNRGIIFHKDALTGCNGITGVGSAILMAKGHQIEWWASGTTSPTSYIRCDMTGGAGVQRILIDNGGFDFGTETFDYIRIGRVDNAVNGFTFRPEIAGAPPGIFTYSYSDPNVDLKLQPQGTGKLRFGTHATTSDAPITGYIEIKDNSTGTIRKLAVIS